uniref:Uncharacterized protein n=1 Tax=Octopus bimaculoides TaxID=37653 RepID=A0A0L8HHY8_OCTBM
MICLGRQRLQIRTQIMTIHLTHASLESKCKTMGCCCLKIWNIDTKVISSDLQKTLC